MNFLAFGGFVARLLGADNGSARPQEQSKNDSYAPIARQFENMNRTVDRIGGHMRQLQVHEQRLHKLEKIVNRIERIRKYMQTYEYQQLVVDYPGTREELLEEIEDLRYQAKVLLP